ncbi:hypothetical protein D7Y45_02990 [Stenotrophomonas maltophilia]|nr:hypothetical protein [Stenotrophomonas maltophilia]
MGKDFSENELLENSSSLIAGGSITTTLQIMLLETATKLPGSHEATSYSSIYLNPLLPTLVIDLIAFSCAKESTPLKLTHSLRLSSTDFDVSP